RQRCHRQKRSRAASFFRVFSHLRASEQNFNHFTMPDRQRKELLGAPVCNFSTILPVPGFVHRFFIVICEG
ncbi:MAG: hypothetical protein PUB82_06495, partial [Clostridiales bacterium]|nr:hypothetical protein [Clostridiales bacterium]